MARSLIILSFEWSFFRLFTMIAWNLSWFTTILLFLNQWVIAFNLNVNVNSETVFEEVGKVLLLEKLYTDALETRRNKWFIKKRLITQPLFFVIMENSFMKIEKEREVRQFNSSKFLCRWNFSRVARCLLLFGGCSTRNFEGFFLRIVNKKVIHINLQIKILICQQFENWISFKLKTLSNLSGY